MMCAKNVHMMICALTSEESSGTAYEPLTTNNAAIKVRMKSFMIEMITSVASMMLLCGR